MAKRPEGRQKVQTLTIRLDEKTRFILEFMARVKGQTMTTILERALISAADNTYAGPPKHNGGYEEARNWRAYWHENEGVRTIKMLSDFASLDGGEVTTDHEEDQLISFIREHYEFFAITEDLDKPAVPFVAVLWPNIQEYLRHWLETRSEDRWATGHLMLKQIKAAGMRGPDWPRQAVKSLPAPKSDLDDEIPF